MTVKKKKEGITLEAHGSSGELQLKKMKFQANDG